MGALAAAGLLAGTVGGIVMVLSPPLVQQLLSNPVAGTAVVAGALGTAVALLLWSRETRNPDTQAFIAAITVAGGMVVILNVLAPALGWWAGPVFAGPLLPLAMLTGLKVMAIYFALLLLLYRWLAARRQWLALLTYLLILIALIPVTVKADELVLRSGLLTFGNGYTVWHDVLVGEVFFVLPPLFYEFFRRNLRRRT